MSMTVLVIALLQAAGGPAPVVPPPVTPAPPTVAPQPSAPAAAGVGPSSPPAPGDGASLDDLLGIGGTGTDRSAADRAEKVERSLSGAEPREILDSAIDDMRRSASLLAEREAGLPTRRAQESVVRKLDELIASAERMKREQQSSSSSSSSSRGQQQSSSKPGSRDGRQSGQEGEQAQEPKGGMREGDRRPGTERDNAGEDGERNRAAGDADADRPPPAADPTQQDAQFDEARAEWGRLPPRVRDAVRQGFRDPMSSAYRRQTQDYYRRLAGEAPR